MRLHSVVVTPIVCVQPLTEKSGTECTLGKMIYDDDLGYSFKYLIRSRFCRSSGFTHLFNLTLYDWAFRVSA